ncbi:MAG: glycoside hydrolase family 99-like domain-containing protein [Betaproteobacteria bacterium]|nr:glycoside hydrolase family 99-like domain-containing protein [Betaproteobacteria bacterium]
MPELRQWISWRDPVARIRKNWRDWRGLPTVFEHAKVIESMLSTDPAGHADYPCVIPNWDNTPRSGNRGLVLNGSSPELFRGHLRRAIELVSANEPQRRIVFIKSWNEWAEGNYLEPDQQFGRGYLEAVKSAIADFERSN